MFFFLGFIKIAVLLLPPTPTETETEITKTETETETETDTETETETTCGYGTCAHYKFCKSCFIPGARCPDIPNIDDWDFYLTVSEDQEAFASSSFSSWCLYLENPSVDVQLCAAKNTIFDATSCGGTSKKFKDENEFNLGFLDNISSMFNTSYGSCHECCDCPVLIVPTPTNEDIVYPPTPTETIPYSNCDYCNNPSNPELCPPRPTITKTTHHVSALFNSPMYILFENNCYYQTPEEFDLNRVYNPIGQDNCDTCYSLNFYRL